MNKEQNKKEKEYVPDYDQECDNCGQSPVVTIVKNGRVTHNFEMCGLCTFGSDECIDPENW